LWKEHKRKHAVDAVELNKLFSSVFNNTPSIGVQLEITAIETEIFLSKIKKGAPGLDEVPYWVFRDFRRELAPAIAILFNRCFANKSWPMVFKLSNVIPVPKCQRPKPDEFRPISLLPILSKIGEKIVLKKWLIPHVVSHMDKHQFAFIPGTGKGTTCALTWKMSESGQW
jgi:hypothetical protein